MLRRLVFLVLGAGLLPAGSLAAQANGRCVLVTDKPPQLLGARGYVMRVGSLESTGRNEKPRHLQSGMRVLMEDEGVAKHENQVGRAYLLGKLLALWLRQDGSHPVETRKTLGLSGSQDEQIDLFPLIDSVLSVVERSNPSCTDSTTQYRESVFSSVYNPAVTAQNARQYDSALVLATRALVVAPRSGKTWNLIAQAKYGKGDTPGYEEALRKVIEYGPSDSTLKLAVEQAYFNLGTLKMQEAQRAQDDARTALAREAEQIFRKYSELKPDDPTGKVRLAQTLQMLGDTVGVNALYAEMLKAPEQYSATSLAEAGVASFRAGRHVEAMAFFDESLKKNPYHPQTLFNFINAALSAHSLDAATARLPRLFEVDPSNTDNFTLAARAWQMVFMDSSASSTPERKKIGTDSTLYYLQKGQEAKLHVKFDPFAPAPGNAQALSGTVENRGDAARSFELIIECLNATGAVVASATVPIPDVGAKNFKQFRATCTGASIVGVRYKPVS
jgi:tetratricopeptide (TPR) repeat protein